MTNRILTKEELVDLVKQVCNVWEFELPRIEFLKIDYMTTTLAVAILENTPFHNKIIKDNMIIFNEIVLAYPFNKVMQIIYHELLHLITKKEDDDIEFIIACKINNVPLSEEWEEM